MDILSQVVVQLATLVLATWGLAQGISKAHPRVNALWVAVVVGPALAVLALRYGFFPLAVQVAKEAGANPYGTAAFGGFIATICAKLGNDYVYNPLRELAKKLGGKTEG